MRVKRGVESDTFFTMRCDMVGKLTMSTLRGCEGLWQSLSLAFPPKLMAMLSHFSMLNHLLEALIRR